MEILLVIIFLIIVFAIILALKNRADAASERADKAEHSKKSMSVKYGQLSEQFMPFLDDFPYESQNFRFIGKPIDGIVFDFEQDKIVFMEFKVNSSQLNDNQKKVKDMVSRGRVFFETMRIK